MVPRTTTITFLVTALITISMSPCATAAWAPNGAAVCTASGNQYGPMIVPDGAGGSILTWDDPRNGDYDIYVQRLDAAGNATWTADGVCLCNAAGDQRVPVICSDGDGGAILVWEDYRNGYIRDIYAQRIDASGAAVWTTNGVPLCTSFGTQLGPSICTDGAGGAIAAWGDSRSGNADIYAQLVDSSGTIQWTTNGVPICSNTSHQQDAAVVPDGSGGAVVAWMDQRNDVGDIYAQRVSALGAAQWTADGVAICNASVYQYGPVIASDSAGGAIIAWHDDRTGSLGVDIYAQRVDSSGSVQWSADGIAVCGAAAGQYRPVMISDGAGGAVMAWYDSRSGSSNMNIYSQRVSSAGAALWTVDGVALCTATDTQRYPAIVDDGTGGAIVAWEDKRNGTDYDVYAQRIDGLGSVQWAVNGVSLCSASGDQDRAAICSDGYQGAIVAWGDGRAADDDIYAQRVTSYGAVLGNLVPIAGLAVLAIAMLLVVFGLHRLSVSRRICTLS